MKNVILLSLLCLCISGCTKTVYVDRVKVVEKKVPIYPEVPNVECDFYKQSYEEILNSLYGCIITQKKLLDTIRTGGQ